MKSILIGGVEYSIADVPFIEVNGDKNILAAIHHKTTEILIVDSASFERRKDLLVHEIMHGVFYEAGFEDSDEDMVNRLAKVLRSVLSENDLSEFRPEINELWADGKLIKVD